MATYDNSYAIKITPNIPTLRGLTTTYSNDGKEDLHGIGLGDLYGLDYDRDKIESIFNNATDKKYEVMKRENEIAQNQYANNQFANQQSAIESLRAQRNEQIASGMARGLNAAQEQGTILGVQQESAAGALELANKQQLAADQIAAEYAENVIKALQEANSVKEAMANVSSALYEADMMGYTGELNAAAQMDANASNRYGSELGAEATKYAADQNLKGALAQAAATRAAAAASAGSGASKDDEIAIVAAYKKALEKDPNMEGNQLVSSIASILQGSNTGYGDMDSGKVWEIADKFVVNYDPARKSQTWADSQKNQTKYTVTNTSSSGSNNNLVRGQTMSYWRAHPDLAASYGIQL